MSLACLDLCGSWQFKEYPVSARKMDDLGDSDWLETKVPGSIFTSLVQSGRINRADLYAREEDFSDISEKPWIFRKIFDAPAELTACDRIELVFDGLDTIATVWLNEKLIARTSNMFVAQRIDVTGLVKPEKNCLMVKFEPAVRYAVNLMKRHKAFDSSGVFNPHRAYIRKAQYQFGWDFCPSLPGCGIWQRVRLEGSGKARLQELHIRTVDCNARHADIRVEVGLDIFAKEEFSCRLTLPCGEREICQHLVFEAGQRFQSTVIRIEKPSLWWPIGYGEQFLYELRVELFSEDEVIDHTVKQFGIRTVKLKSTPDESARGFGFEINNQTIFAKGANWVPASIFAGSVEEEDYEKLLCMAARSGINMLRVWGGGYYEAEKFYELCDRLGIMVWQDFMFACSYYPDQPWFLAEIKKEAEYVVKRLRDHPCIMLWCGNNEIDWMHAAGKMGKSRKFHGKKIFHNLLPQIVKELDPHRAYTPTTPLPRRGSFDRRQSLTVHNWDIWSGHQSAGEYICPAEDIPPFVTEFGLQSVPDVETLREFCPADKLRIAGRFIEKHNYQLDGNSRLFRYIADIFGGARDIEEFVYLSQITQARAVKTYVEHLRAHNYRNSGVLFWQFNDCFPALSWSAIDYMKRPKALYYYSKRFFAGHLIAVIPEFKKDQSSWRCEYESLDVVVVNDTGRPVTAQLSCRIIDLSGRELDRIIRPVAVGPFSGSKRLKLPREMVLPAEPERCCLHLALDAEGQKIAENMFFYLPDKYMDWTEPEITSRLCKIDDTKWKVELKSNTLVKDLQIRSVAPAELSDNFIDIMPQSQCEVEINFTEPICDVESTLGLKSIGSILAIHPRTLGR